jgi:hypothetical protein
MLWGKGFLREWVEESAFKAGGRVEMSERKVQVRWNRDW